MPSSVTYRDFRPYGAALTGFSCRADEFVLSGPAGTGKTRALLERLHLQALKYPGMRGLMCRKERVSLTQTALVTWEKQVDPTVDGAVWRTQEQEWRYPNGSVIVVAGLDKAAVKIMSGQYDVIYINEVTELIEGEWENLTTRLRNGVMPYQQIYGDCNPDAPSHWLRLRADAGRTLMFESRHEDNPSVTPEYLARLDALTGVRYQRLRLGNWAAAEGMVYDGWDRKAHLLPSVPLPDDYPADNLCPAGIPREWDRYWGIDFGYTNPFCFQSWAKDGDGRLYRYREIYRTQRLVEDHARAILAVTQGEPRPRAIICDHDAEDRATFERHTGMRTDPAPKAVDAGIQLVAARLKPAGDGKPRLFFIAGALTEVDSNLIDKRLPTCSEQEIEAYVWDTTGGRRKGEQPVKSNDHGMDCARYVVKHIDDGPGRGVWL